MSKATDFRPLVERILAHRERATLVEVSNGPPLQQAEQDGLTLMFYDARHPMTPNTPPLGVEVRAEEQLVFRAYVDPDNLGAAPDFTKWQRGAWEAKLAGADA